MYLPVQSYTLALHVNCFESLSVGDCTLDEGKYNFLVGLLFLHTKKFYFTAVKQIKFGTVK